MVPRTKIDSLFMNHLRLCSKAERLLDLAEKAAAQPGQNAKQLAAIGTALSEMSVDGLTWAGMYYKALALNHSHDNRARAEQMLMEAASHGTPLVRAKALVALGTNSIENNSGEATGYYDQAEKVNPGNVLVAFSIQSLRAVLKSIAGDHTRALEAFEALKPMADAIGARLPFYFYNFINSLAYSHLKAGNQDQAEGLAEVLKRSPVKCEGFDETFDEIASKRNQKRQAFPGYGLSIPQQREFCVNALINNPSDRIVTGCYAVVEAGR